MRQERALAHARPAAQEQHMRRPPGHVRDEPVEDLALDPPAEQGRGALPRQPRSRDFHNRRRDVARLAAPRWRTAPSSAPLGRVVRRAETCGDSANGTDGPGTLSGTAEVRLGSMTAPIVVGTFLVVPITTGGRV